jgi:hypothetical protein
MRIYSIPLIQRLTTATTAGFTEEKSADRRKLAIGDIKAA